MAQSLSQMYVHIIVRIKSNSPTIRVEEEKEFYTSIAAVIRENKCNSMYVNGVSDHVHIVCVLSKNVAIAKLLEELKRNTSKWLKSKNEYYKDFAWQGGYGAFSVSPKVLEKTRMNIENQKSIHKNQSFNDEYVAYLQEYQVEYDEKIVWVD